MTNKRTVVLFGAGAPLAWGAPTTSELTNIVRKSGFYTKVPNIRISEFIYNKLIQEGGYSEDEVNFETIINVIEELIVYYSIHGVLKKKHSIIKSFFSSNFEDDIMNFIVVSDATTERYYLKIPNVSDEWAQHSHGRETPQQFFLQQLLAIILTNISVRIETYAYHTKSISDILTNKNLNINTLFQNWASSIIKDSVFRMYTLNYDRLFKILLSNMSKPLEVFEGFDCDEFVDYIDKIRPNPIKIVSNTDCHCHYNLHGSVYWRVDTYNHHQLELPHFYLSSSAYVEENTDEYPLVQSEKGKTVYLTNIVTGYQKTQRAIFTPFKQMQSAFDKDSLLCDKLIIIGYSFGDEHINTSIRTALEFNPGLNVEIIDPSFKNNDFDIHVMTNIFSASMQGFSIPTNIDNNIHGFFNNTIIVYAKTFTEYMDHQINNFNRYNNRY